MKLKAIFAMITLSALTLSCIDQHINIENIIGTPSDNNSNNNNNNKDPNANKYTISFRGEVNTIATKAISPIQANRFVDIYAYIQKGDFVTSASYISEETGVLSPVRSGSIILAQGAYEIYAFGVANKTSPFPLFDVTNGFINKGGLTNGNDYIIASVADSITKNTNLSLVFNHVCTQLVIDIATDNTSLKLDSIISPTISQPTTTSNLVSLFTGQITSSTSLQSIPLPMNITGTQCHQILLPLKYNGNLTMSFGALFEGNNNQYNYKLNIPVVNGVFSGGNSYKFKVVINSSSASIINASINDWKEIDETGQPISPEIASL